MSITIGNNNLISCVYTCNWKNIDQTKMFNLIYYNACSSDKVGQIMALVQAFQGTEVTYIAVHESSCVQQIGEPVWIHLVALDECEEHMSLPKAGEEAAYICCGYTATCPYKELPGKTTDGAKEVVRVHVSTRLWDAHHSLQSYL